MACFKSCEFTIQSDHLASRPKVQRDRLALRIEHPASKSLCLILQADRPRTLANHLGLRLERSRIPSMGHESRPQIHGSSKPSWAVIVGDEHSHRTE